MLCKLDSLDPVLLYETRYSQSTIKIYVRKRYYHRVSWRVEIYIKDIKSHWEDYFSPPTVLYIKSKPIIVVRGEIDTIIYNSHVELLTNCDWWKFDTLYRVYGYNEKFLFCKCRENFMMMNGEYQKYPPNFDKYSDIITDFIPIGCKDSVRYENYVIDAEGLYFLWDLKWVSKKRSYNITVDSQNNTIFDGPIILFPKQAVQLQNTDSFWYVIGKVII